MPRRGEHGETGHDDIRATAPDAVARIGPRVVAGELRGRRHESRVDPGDFRCSRLVGQLADELVRYAEAMALSAGSCSRHVSAVARFGRYVDKWADDPAAVDLLRSPQPDIVELIDGWERAMQTEFVPTSTRPQALIRTLLLIVAEFADSHHIEGHLRARAASGPTFPPSPQRPLDEFTNAERIAMERAAKHCIQRSELRLAEGRRWASAGVHPDEGGWDRLDNLLHLAADRIPTAGLLAAALPRWWDDLPDEVRQVVGPPPTHREGGWSAARLRDWLADMLVPSALELMAYVVLLGLRLGVSPEELLALRSSSIVFADDAVRVRWDKARAGRVRARRYLSPAAKPTNSPTEKEVSDGGRRRFDARLVLEGLLAATRIARRQSGEKDPIVWITATRGQITRVDFSVRRSFRAWLAAHEITIGGSPELRRLRKTHKTVRALALGGVISDTADDHTIAVFEGHYMHTTTLNVMAGRTINTVEEWIVGRATGPLVIAGGDSTLRVPEAQRATGLAGSTVEDLLAGQLDVGLAACRNIFDSPFAETGTACPVAPARCMVCPNALILSTHLPRLLRFVDHLDGRRLELTPQAWESLWGPTYRNIVNGILPQFTDQQLRSARADIADAEVDLPIGMRAEFVR
jgi:hypothetical protein